jgi:hypothetical protein
MAHHPPPPLQSWEMKCGHWQLCLSHQNFELALKREVSSDDAKFLDEGDEMK